jgi:flavin-dependent dehydrogenase
MPSTTAPLDGRYDAVVVGARAAGAATSMLLARAGHRVLVVDRSAHGSDTLSTHALLRGAVVQLHRWGLLERIVAGGTPVIPEVTFRYPDKDLTIAVEPVGVVGGFVAPKRTVLDPVLVDAAEAAGAVVAHRTSVRGLLRDGDGAVSGVAGVDQDGCPFTATAPIVVGADGTRSFVARSVGAPTLVAGRYATGLAYAAFAGIETRGYEWCWAPGCAAGVIPTDDGHAVVFASVPAARFRDTFGADVETGFHRVLTAVHPDVAARVRTGGRVSRFRSFPGIPGHVRRSFGPGWALVGDAGYWKDPISAHGLTDALRDAELLADAVDRALVGQLDQRSALAAYQATRDELSRPLFDVTDRIAAMDWTIPDLERLLRVLSAAMEPEVRHLVAAARPEVGAAA